MGTPGYGRAFGRWAAGLFTAALCAACAATQTLAPRAVDELPYSIVPPGHFVVPVTVNGEGPFRFFIDTAATHTVMFERLRKRLGLVPLAGETRLVKSAFGGARRPAYMLRELRMGMQTFRDYETTTLPDGTVRQWEPDGAIGLDILSRYHFAFFHGRKTMVLYDRSRPLPDDFLGWTPVPVRLDSLGLLYIAAQVDKELMLAILDLGSDNNIMNEAAARLVVRSGERQYMRRVTLIDTFSNEIEAPVTNGNVIAIAGLSFRNQPIAIAPEGFLDPAFDRIPLIVIGGDLLNEADFAMDFNTPRFMLRQYSLVEDIDLKVYMANRSALREQQRVLDSLELPER